MVNALLLSPAYGWFIGLLVVMIVVTGLFALILFIALRPIKKDFSVEDVSYAKTLLGRREAELTVEIMKNKGNVEVMEGLMKKLREVTVAEKLIDELADSGEIAQSSAPAKSSKKPLTASAKASQTAGAQANRQNPPKAAPEQAVNAPDNKSE